MNPMRLIVVVALLFVVGNCRVTKNKRSFDHLLKTLKRSHIKNGVHEVCEPSKEHQLGLGRWMSSSYSGSETFLRPVSESSTTSSPRSGCHEPSTDIKAPMAERAICPWRWEVNYDPTVGKMLRLRLRLIP